MPVPARRLESGTIWVDVTPEDDAGRVAFYARVSWHDQRADLDRQFGKAAEAAAGVVGPVGDGGVVVGHRDRLARFGVRYLDAAVGGARPGGWPIGAGPRMFRSPR